MMDLTLTHIGLTIATGILLVIVLSLIFTNDWQRNAELQSQASSFSNLLSDVENSFFEQIHRFQFPQKSYAYSVMISIEYIRITTKSAWAGDLIVTEKLLASPWFPLPQQNWTTGDSFHTYLNTTYGHHGTQNDSLSLENFTNLSQGQHNMTMYFALHPLEICINEPVFIEKITIFYNQTTRQDFLLLYQRV